MTASECFTPSPVRKKDAANVAFSSLVTDPPPPQQTLDPVPEVNKIAKKDKPDKTSEAKLSTGNELFKLL